jgi:hypothetical protein
VGNLEALGSGTFSCAGLVLVREENVKLSFKKLPFVHLYTKMVVLNSSNVILVLYCESSIILSFKILVFQGTSVRLEENLSLKVT